MTYSLIIRNGTIIDGLGGEPYVGDVAVRDGVITTVGHVNGDTAGREIHANGLLVTPGFVDLHTHYDGQAIWSERLTPSSAHGVTLVVIGNCGVGFAPCRQEDHDVLVDVMGGVEDIPGVVMTDGLPWNWETFPEYMKALDAGKRDIDVAAYLPHSPLRVYVMGQRGGDREPGIPGGASQPGVRPVFGVAEDVGLPVTFTLVIGNIGDPTWPDAINMIEKANAAGGDVPPQLLPRPIGLIMGLQLSANPFVLYPSYREIADLPLAERVAEMRKPEVRARILADKPGIGHPILVVTQMWDWIFPLTDNPDYEPDPS